MTFEREQYRELMAKKKGDGQQSPRPVLEILAQAELNAANLTGDSTWDIFLSYIQAAIERTEAEIKTTETLLGSPEVVEIPDLMRLKIQLARLKERVSAWNAVISLPKDIKIEGEKAKTLLERMAETEKKEQMSEVGE